MIETFRRLLTRTKHQQNMAEKGEESPTAMRLRTALGPERENQHFIIIGLGRFGSSVAETLVKYGHDVLAIDSDAERVRHLSGELPHVVQLDATKAEALEHIGVSNFDTGVVAISNNFESNLLATVHLLKAGVNHVVTKAKTHTQKSILESVGANEVILPEHEAGVHWARRLAFTYLVDYLEISRGVGIIELIAPPSLCGLNLVQCNLRKQYGLTVIAVHRDENVIVSPEPDFRIETGDILAVVGQIENAEQLQK